MIIGRCGSSSGRENERKGHVKGGGENKGMFSLDVKKKREMLLRTTKKNDR